MNIFTVNFKINCVHKHVIFTYVKYNIKDNNFLDNILKVIVI